MYRISFITRRAFCVFDAFISQSQHRVIFTLSFCFLKKTIKLLFVGTVNSVLGGGLQGLMLLLLKISTNVTFFLTKINNNIRVRFLSCFIIHSSVQITSDSELRQTVDTVRWTRLLYRQAQRGSGVFSIYQVLTIRKSPLNLKNVLLQFVER